MELFLKREHRSKDVGVWCHELELKNAFWSCAANIERIRYRPHYLDPEILNWETFSEMSFEIWQGVTLDCCTAIQTAR